MNNQVCDRFHDIHANKTYKRYSFQSYQFITVTYGNWWLTCNYLEIHNWQFSQEHDQKLLTRQWTSTEAKTAHSYLNENTNLWKHVHHSESMGWINRLSAHTTVKHHTGERQRIRHHGKHLKVLYNKSLWHLIAAVFREIKISSATQ